MPAAPVAAVLLLRFKLRRQGFIMVKLLQYLVFVCFCIWVTDAFAQDAAAKSKPRKSAANNADDDNTSLNKKDVQNRKQGMWYYVVAPLRGEPGYKEFGNYKNDLRTGLWYRLDNEDQLMAVENYKKGVLNGEAQYYSKGRLSCIGQYRGLNPDNKLDSIWVTDPVTYADTMIIVPTEQGTLRHGKWRYYDPMSGRLTREEEYQVDSLISEKDYNFVSTSDSLLIEQRKANLPHITNPTGKNPKRRTPRYTY